MKKDFVAYFFTPYVRLFRRKLTRNGLHIIHDMNHLVLRDSDISSHSIERNRSGERENNMSRLDGFQWISPCTNDRNYVARELQRSGAKLGTTSRVTQTKWNQAFFQRLTILGLAHQQVGQFFTRTPNVDPSLMDRFSARIVFRSVKYNMNRKIDVIVQNIAFTFFRFHNFPNKPGTGMQSQIVLETVLNCFDDIFYSSVTR